MKSLIKLLVPVFALVGGLAHGQVVLQNFSAVVGANTFFYGTWTQGDAFGDLLPNSQFVQNEGGTYDITGSNPIIPLNNADSYIEFFNSSAVSIGSNLQLSVTAQPLAGNTASSFVVSLIDSNGKIATSAFATGSFLPNLYTTQISALTLGSGFNPLSIDSMQISGNLPGGTDVFHFSFDLISAVAAPVPEPSTYALLALGLGLVALPVLRRRRS